MNFTKKDFRVDWFSGTGAGGQYRNKHQNCCRITHKESGLRATGQSHRERPANQKEAFDKLAKLLIAHYSPEGERAREISNERIRTYSACKNLVIDHASGFTQEYRYVVDKNNIEDMIQARLKAKNV